MSDQTQTPSDEPAQSAPAQERVAILRERKTYFLGLKEFKQDVPKPITESEFQHLRLVKATETVVKNSVPTNKEIAMFEFEDRDAAVPAPARARDNSPPKRGAAGA